MRYAFLFLLLFSRSFAHAQAGFAPEIGVGMSTMYFAPSLIFTSANTAPVFSGRIGGIADLRFNRHIYIQPGLFLSRKGQTRDFSYYTSDTLNLAVHQTLSMNYLEVPLAIVYKSGEQGRGRVTIGLGVAASYLVGGRDKIESHGASNGTTFNISSNTSITSSSPVDLFDIGVHLNGGYELPTGLYFRIYYTSGAKDIGLGTEIDKNRMWGVSAGYFFGKGRNIKKETEGLIDKSTD